MDKMRNSFVSNLAYEFNYMIYNNSDGEDIDNKNIIKNNLRKRGKLYI